MGLRNWALRKSPWILHFNTGSCNGCDIELVATLTPRYDIERFGMYLRGSPRHADILLVTGPVTRQVRDRIVRIYNQMPFPKSVVAIGSCCMSGGVFSNCGKGPCYNVYAGLDQLIPVNAYIPGCPPKPEAIIDGVAKLLESMKATKRKEGTPDEPAQ
jgi:NADH-quinone oxidoreductase B subunit